MSLKSISVGNGSKNAVVFLHGYGANKEDLLPIGKMYNKQTDSFDSYFYDAPIEVPMSFGGKCWFPIDFTLYEKAYRENNLTLLTTRSVEPMKQSLDNLKVEISHLKSNYNKIIMGGFSQGSMVALELFLTSNHLFDGLFLLSSALLDYSFSSLHKSNCPIFQSHGVQDQVLKISLGRQLHNKLTPKSKVEYMEFQGGHEIPPSVLEALYIYIQKQLS